MLSAPADAGKPINIAYLILLFLATFRRWQQIDGKFPTAAPAPRSVGFKTKAHGARLDFSRPGKPTDNALMESFNGRVRAECLNETWFLSLDHARTQSEAWRQDDNNHRPHSAVGNLAPREFARSSQVTEDR